MKSYLQIIFYLFLVSQTFGQVYSNKVVGDKNAALSDSIKAKDYPYALPIWGAKATKLGFDLPYSAGINVNYLWQESALTINNLMVGFNGGTLYNLDEIVVFNDATAETNAVNFRPDVWLLPFLNVYGLFAKSTSSTAIDFGIWAPDGSGGRTEIFTAATKANFNGTTFGMGMTPTIGVGGGFMALDMNVAWTDIDALEKPAFTFVFGPRLGKSFKISKEGTVAIWVGGFRVKLSSDTNGSLAIGDLFDSQTIEAKIANGIVRLDEAQVGVDTWWGGLSNSQQNNPANKAKYAAANRALEAAGNFLGAASTAVENIEQSTVQYSLDKKQADLWNFIVGGQFQLNKHFMLRAEYGFLSTRKQFVGGIQYRFGL